MKTRFLASCLFLSISAALLFAFRTPALGQEASDTIYDIKKAKDYGIEAPKPLYHPDPEYTDRARKKKISGTVLLSIIVTPEGAVRDAIVTKSLNKDLDQQALRAVSTWKFQPATKDGQPVSVRMAVEADFRLY